MRIAARLLGWTKGTVSGRLARALVESGGTTCIDCTARTLGASTDRLASQLLKLQHTIAVGSAIAWCRRCERFALVLKI